MFRESPKVIIEDPDAPSATFAANIRMEDLLEKLKLLNYDTEFVQKYKMKYISRHYFMVPTNPGEQFFMFTSLAAWLIRKAGKNFDPPQESDDPNATISQILDFMKSIDAAVDFPPNKLKQGVGEHAVFVLDHLADNAIKVSNFKWQKSQVPPDETEVEPELEEDDAELILEKVEEEMVTDYDDEEDDAVHEQLLKVKEKYRDISGGVQERTKSLNRLTDELEQVKKEMDERGASMTDGTPLINIKKTVGKMKSEISEMSLRIGVLEYSLMCSRVRDRVQLQEDMKAAAIMQAADSPAAADKPRFFQAAATADPQYETQPRERVDPDKPYFYLTPLEDKNENTNDDEREKSHNSGSDQLDSDKSESLDSYSSPETLSVADDRAQDAKVNTSSSNSSLEENGMKSDDLRVPNTNSVISPMGASKREDSVQQSSRENKFAEAERSRNDNSDEPIPSSYDLSEQKAFPAE
ncbi:unnamed protein product [Trichogramma brassicae]|uniref:Intraflagellar transport protein 57 homolog n=1 Tax=Trichogramma brassicae TaxID=86971 RepID=A0A6H5J8M9_9HYME|nr:unnamed protein product [Trichogramma brassicae]